MLAQDIKLVGPISEHRHNKLGVICHFEVRDVFAEGTTKMRESNRERRVAGCHPSRYHGDEECDPLRDAATPQAETTSTPVPSECKRRG